MGIIYTLIVIEVLLLTLLFRSLFNKFRELRKEEKSIKNEF